MRKAEFDYSTKEKQVEFLALPEGEQDRVVELAQGMASGEKMYRDGSLRSKKAGHNLLQLLEDNSDERSFDRVKVEEADLDGIAKFKRPKKNTLSRHQVKSIARNNLQNAKREEKEAIKDGEMMYDTLKGRIGMAPGVGMKSGARMAAGQSFRY